MLICLFCLFELSVELIKLVLQMGFIEFKVRY
nr:MAG TPA: hypothetical protein [Caudoviricetes sp.]